MSGSQINPYLRTKVMTAGPEELRLMLFDGAIKFCRQAADAIGRQEWEAGYHALIRAQKIVLELSTSLKPDMAPELCAKLASLYNYIYRRLVDANLERDASPVHEAIKLLEYERETWIMAMKKKQRLEQGDSGAPPQADQANPLSRIGPHDEKARQTALSSFTLEG